MFFCVFYFSIYYSFSHNTIYNGAHISLFVLHFLLIYFRDRSVFLSSVMCFREREPN